MRFAIPALALAAAFSGSAFSGSSEGTKPELVAACPAHLKSIDASRAAIPACEAFIADQPPGTTLLSDALAAKPRLQLNAMESEDALASAQEALRIDPDHLDAGVAKVDALVMLGRWSEVREDIERLRTLYPGDPLVLRHYAQYVGIVGTTEDALAALEKAMEAAPEDPMLHHQKAGLLAGLGRTEEAIAELDAILDGGPADGNLLSFRAGLLLSIGEAERAIADIEKAESNGVRSGAGRFIVVRAELILGDFEAALASLDAAQADPVFREDAPLLPIYRFAILDRLGRSKEAQEALAEFTAATERQFVLRMQVFLRNMGFETVEISGEMDEATKRHFAACLANRACGASVSRAI